MDFLQFSTSMIGQDIFMKDIFPMFDHLEDEIDMEEQYEGFIIELSR